MDQLNWDIRVEGRTWESREALQRHNLICDFCRVEMINGKLCWSDEQRLFLLALLLENLGAKVAVGLGDPAVWRDAVGSLGVGNLD